MPFLRRSEKYVVLCRVVLEQYGAVLEQYVSVRADPELIIEVWGGGGGARAIVRGGG